MGKPSIVINNVTFRISEMSEPAEVKHLSKRRKGKKFYSPSSGERKGISPNLMLFTA